MSLKKENKTPSFTQEQIAHHLANPLSCPYCKHPAILQDGNIDFGDNDTILDEAECDKCGKRWQKTYSVSAIEPLEDEEEEEYIRSPGEN